MNIEAYRTLYEAVANYERVQPWQLFYDAQCIRLVDTNKKVYYCTIMGKFSEHVGLSIYEGEEGLADLLSLTEQYPEGVSNYVFYDQKCISLYFGDRDEVPLEQLRMMEELQLKYPGRGSYPFFYSLKPHYFPWSMDDNEAKLMSDILYTLCNAFEEVGSDQLVDYGEILEIQVGEDYFDFNSIPRPEILEKYTPMALDIPEILDHIGMCYPSENHIMLDLVYVGSPFSIEGDRPINPLIGLIVNSETKEIQGHYLVDQKDEDISVVISLLCTYSSKFGRPVEIIVRNPRVYEALVYICDMCEIELSVASYSITDEIVADMDFGNE